MPRSVGASLVLPLAAALWACGAPVPEPATEAPATAAAPGVIEVKADEYAFTAPPTFPSGWVTLHFDNQGVEPHFLAITRLPEGKTFDDYASQVAPHFNDLYVEYRAGRLDQATFLDQLVAAMPEWIFAARAVGGPGFTAPGRSSTTTIHLDPGNYVMECYVRAMTQDDTFHEALGMLRPLIVTDEPSGGSPPQADVEITLSNYTLAVAGELSPGPHVARVRVQEDPEGFIFHNVQLASLAADATAEQAAAWLDWVDAMVPPAPAVFLGGAGQMSAGGESYFSFDLEPGRYAWVSEAYGTRGMVHEFTVE
jgi:hypothetical protein